MKTSPEFVLFLAVFMSHYYEWNKAGNTLVRHKSAVDVNREAGGVWTDRQKTKSYTQYPQYRWAGDGQTDG